MSNKMDFVGLTFQVTGLENASGTSLALVEAQSTPTVTAYDGTSAVGATYDQAEVQAIATALDTLSDEMVALKAALVSAGIFV